MTYQPTDIRAPRIAGAALRLLAPLAESTGLGNLIRAQMLTEAGVKRLRSLQLSEGPSVEPSLPHMASATAPASVQHVDTDGPESVTGFVQPTAVALAHSYRTGETDPMAVADRALAAMEKAEQQSPAMRMFIAYQATEVRRMATESANRWRAGTPLSPLDGVPVAVKDELDMVPFGTTAGTSFAGQEPVMADATVVARLRAAGAVLLGKTNMHEFGMGVTGVNPHHGAVRNPHDPACFTGGSSSGSAAAVAAGLCPISVGADGGGSVRIPASLCGVVGLKATFGRISEGGVAPLCWSVGHVGPLGATARDVALAYALMAGPDPHDVRSLLQPPLNTHDFRDPDLSGVTLGVHPAWFEDADPEVVAACKRALDGLKVLGAHVVEVEIPHLADIRAAHLVTIVSEMAVARQTLFTGTAAQYGSDTRLNMAIAGALSSLDYVQAQRVRTRAVNDLNRIMAKVDGIVTPTTACTAQPIRADGLRGESNLAVTDRIMRFAQLANLTGFPAISFPAGYDGRGMPVGLQVMARPWEEALLLRVAHAAEGVVERRRPRALMGQLLG